MIHSKIVDDVAKLFSASETVPASGPVKTMCGLIESGRVGSFSGIMIATLDEYLTILRNVSAGDASSPELKGKAISETYRLLLEMIDTAAQIASAMVKPEGTLSAIVSPPTIEDDIVRWAVDDNLGKIPLIKETRAKTGMGLKEAKDLVERVINERLVIEATGDGAFTTRYRRKTAGEVR